MLAGRAVRVHSLIEKAKQATGMHRRDISQPYVVGVAGGVASGRLTFCQQLIKCFGEEGVLLIPEETFVKYSDELLHGHSSFLPEFDWEKRSYAAGWQVVTSQPVIIVVGLSALAESSLSRHINCRVFIDTPADLRLRRRAERECEISEEELKASIAAEDSTLVPFRAKAEVVVHGEGGIEQAAIETSTRILDEFLAQRHRF